MEGSPHRTPKVYTSPATPPAQPILAASPTSSPFRNIKPKTRQERAALRDKVALEKDRLMKRTGLAAKMYRENAPDTSDGLVVPRPDAAGFMADSDRFHTDVAGEDKLRRDAKIKQDYLRREHTRLERAKAEEQRWARIQQEKANEEANWLAERQAGIKAKRNASSVPFDMVTLQYHDSLDGERLRYHDDKVRYRAAVRSSNLLKNGGSRAGYDILTGGDVRGLQKPSYPQASGVLAEEEEGSCPNGAKMMRSFLPFRGADDDVRRSGSPGIAEWLAHRSLSGGGWKASRYGAT